MAKSTEDLINDLTETKSIDEYFNSNKKELSNKSFAEYLEDLLKAKNLKKPDVILNSNLDRSYAYNLFSGEKKNPTRDKVIALCFGFGLNYDESQHLLINASVGSLYPRDHRDAIIIFALNNKLTMIDCDINLKKDNQIPLTKDLE